MLEWSEPCFFLSNHTFRTLFHDFSLAHIHVDRVKSESGPFQRKSFAS